MRMPKFIKVPKINRLLPTTKTLLKTRSKCTLWMSLIEKRWIVESFSSQRQLLNHLPWHYFPRVETKNIPKRITFECKCHSDDSHVTEFVQCASRLWMAAEWELKSIYDCNSCTNYRHSNVCGHRDVNWCLSSSRYKNIRAISNNRLITWKTFRLATYDSPKIGFFCSSSS